MQQFQVGLLKSSTQSCFGMLQIWRQLPLGHQNFLLNLDDLGIIQGNISDARCQIDNPIDVAA